MSSHLDPELRRRLRDPASTDAGPIRVIVEFTGDLDPLVAAGFAPTTVGGSHPTTGVVISPGVVADAEALGRLAAVDGVERISHPRRLRPQLDYSVPAIHGTPAVLGTPVRGGSGVIIGIIDSGIDWRHGSFIDADGRSRVRALWDQVLTAQGGETVGANKLGVVYEQADLNDDLKNPERRKVRSVDRGIKTADVERPGGHGTHVAGIAAGDGSPASFLRGARTYVGVAPLADLVVVACDLGDDHVIAGIDFILERAGVDKTRPGEKHRPVVINLSFGDMIGPHDGTGVLENKIDEVATKYRACAVVVCAGNYGDPARTPCHVAPTVGATPTVVEAMIVRENLQTVVLDTWYPHSSRLTATLTTPDGVLVGSITHGDTEIEVEGDPAAAKITLISTIRAAPGAGHNLRVMLDGPRKTADGDPAKGRAPAAWRLALRTQTGPVAAHVWSNPPDHVHFRTTDGVQPVGSHTVTAPGDAAAAITVAHHESQGGCCECGPSEGIAPTSSRGPTLTSTISKPTIAAPGSAITSATADAPNLPGNCCACCPDALCCLYRPDDGSSMSAPHVTGTVALMLEEDHNLTSADIVRHLTTSARAAPAPADANVWGAGMLDAAAAVRAVRAAKGPVPPGPPSLGDLLPGGPVHHESRHEHRPADPLPGFGALRGALATRPDGERLAAAVSRHFSEVRRLINTNRRVATMWHRATGPVLLHALLHPCPACTPTAGERERRYFERFLDQLERHGSARLRAGLDAHRAALLALVAP